MRGGCFEGAFRVYWNKQHAPFCRMVFALLAVWTLLKWRVFSVFFYLFFLVSETLQLAGLSCLRVNSAAASLQLGHCTNLSTPVQVDGDSSAAPDQGEKTMEVETLAKAVRKERGESSASKVVVLGLQL